MVLIASANNEGSDKFDVQSLVKALAAHIHKVWM